MPLINIVLQGDLSHNVIKLDRPYKFRHLKLLHLYHNVNSMTFDPKTAREDGTASSHINEHQRVMFAKINFINSENSQTIFIEPDKNTGLGENDSDTHICLGLTKHNKDKTMIFKDLYKVIVDEIPKRVNGQFTIDLYVIDSTGKIVKLIPTDFIEKGSKEHSHMVLTFEFNE
jgi:hypothetical protein